LKLDVRHQEKRYKIRSYKFQLEAKRAKFAPKDFGAANIFISALSRFGGIRDKNVGKSRKGVWWMP
jgi:hypothetical protein